MKKALLIVIAIILTGTNGLGQTKPTANTMRIDKETRGAAAIAADMEWMRGTWEGKAFGGTVREVWENTDGGTMMGMFVLAKDGKPVFYEFMTLVAENNELFLKLKHFNPDMVGWEEKDKMVKFRFIKQVNNRYFFQGLTFENAGNDNLNIYLALRQKDKSYKEEKFLLSRVD